MANNHSTVTCKILPPSGEALSHRGRDKRGGIKREPIILLLGQSMSLRLLIALF
jgi:hypothetical protein